MNDRAVRLIPNRDLETAQIQALTTPTIGIRTPYFLRRRRSSWDL